MKFKLLNILLLTAFFSAEAQQNPSKIKAQGKSDTIKVDSLVKKLNEVTISGKKAFVEQGLDRTVVNVDALISNAGTTALDVLVKSPGVNIDGNGVISLKGKSGVNVFIDDKPTYLSGAELESYLRSLPSSSLEKIELMTNPPAKYDAAGNAGIINIRTKKSKAIGFNGMATVSVNQGELTRSNNSLNLNFRKNKVNVFGNFSHNLNNSFTDLDLNRIYKNTDETPKYFFNQNTLFDRHGNTFNAKVGIDLYHTEKTTWGFVFNGTGRKNSQVNENTSNLLNAVQQPDSIINAKNKDQSVFKNTAVNLNYRYLIGKENGDITADLDYLNYNTQTVQNYINTSYFPDRTLKYTDLLTGDLPSKIDIYTAKVDYAKPLKKGWKLSTGVKTSYTKTDNTANYLYTKDQVTVVDYEKTNRFIYSENISSAYMNVNMEGKWLSLQTGLRLENTHSDGHQLGNLHRRDSTFKRTYTNLFPTVYLSYKLDSIATHQFGINYGKRVERPFYRQLNPFYSPLDKFTYYLGNPFLRPSFTHALELSHTFKNKITTTLAYNWIKDRVNETIEIVDGTYYSRPGNIGKGKIKTISVNADFDLAKWLTTHAYLELDHIVTETAFYTGYLKTNGTFFKANANLQFKLSSTWNAESNFSYQSRLSSVQFVFGAVHEFGAAVQKKLSAKSNIKLALTDIFRTRVYTGVINNLAATDAGWVNKSDSQAFILTYSYRFGKSFSTRTKHNASGADAERQRVGG